MATQTNPRAKIKASMRKTLPSFHDRCKEYLEAQQQVLKRLRISLRFTIAFKKHGQPARAPMLGRLGVWLINRSGGSIDIEARDLDNIQ